MWVRISTEVSTVNAVQLSRPMAPGSAAHPEEVPRLVLAQEQAAVLGGLPLLRHIGCQAPARRILHYQRQVLRQPNGNCELDEGLSATAHEGQRAQLPDSRKAMHWSFWQRQEYLVGEDGLLCLDDVDVPLSKVCLYLRTHHAAT